MTGAPAWLTADDPWVTDKLRAHTALLRAERDIGAGVLTAMTAYLDAARTALLAQGDSGRHVVADATQAPPSLDHWPDDQLWADLVKAYVFGPVGELWLWAYGQVLHGEQPADRGALDAFLAAVLVQLASGFPRRAFAETERELAAGMRRGEPVARLRDRVRRVLTIDAAPRELRDRVSEAPDAADGGVLAALVAKALRAGQGVWQRWAQRVVRTSTGGAYNGGTFTAGDASPRPLVKVWWSRRDQDLRVRDAHVRAHGQVQPYGEPFAVGGEFLMYPGDPAGSAENIVNCRCVVILREVDNQSGNGSYAADRVAWISGVRFP